MLPDMQDEKEFDCSFFLSGICFYLSQLLTLLMTAAAIYPLIIDDSNPHFAYFQSDQGAAVTAMLWFGCFLSIGLTLLLQLYGLKVSISRWWHMRPRSGDFLLASLLSQVLLVLPLVSWLWLPFYFVWVRKLGHATPPVVNQVQAKGIIDPKVNQKGKSGVRKSVKDWTGQK